MLQLAHAEVQWSESPIGQLGYHGSAALVDMIAIYITSVMLSGKLSDEIHAINVASIALNGAGWAAYMAYIEPVWYNTAMTTLIITSYLRLMIGGYDAADTDRRRVLYPFGRSGDKPHQKAEFA
jgi:hypothetical protein